MDPNTNTKPTTPTKSRKDEITKRIPGNYYQEVHKSTLFIIKEVREESGLQPTSRLIISTPNRPHKGYPLQKNLKNLYIISLLIMTTL